MKLGRGRRAKFCWDNFIYLFICFLSELKKRKLVKPVEGSAAVTSKYVLDFHHFLVSITWWHFPFLSLLVNLDINLMGSSHVPFYDNSVRVRLSFPVLWGPSAQSLGRLLSGGLAASAATHNLGYSPTPPSPIWAWASYHIRIQNRAWIPASDSGQPQAQCISQTVPPSSGGRAGPWAPAYNEFSKAFTGCQVDFRNENTIHTDHPHQTTCLQSMDIFLLLSPLPCPWDFWDKKLIERTSCPGF